MSLPLFAFRTLVTTTSPLQFRWTRTDFLPRSRVLFPAARLISCGSRELNLGRIWKASKWECATCDPANFQRVPFNARRRPYSSYYWSLANLNDLKSPSTQKVSSYLCSGAALLRGRWGRTGQSRGSAIHKNDFVSNSVSGWCEHRTTGQVCAQAYVCACKCMCRGGTWRNYKRDGEEK